jgi:hypothetical protein
MRPVERGSSPRPNDFENYRDAFPDLVSRLGPYCSFCERRVPTNLAVEHIQPKAENRYPHLAGRWDNFLLGCVNCNSTKGDRDVVLEQVALPDRDNTFAAFAYTQDGAVAVVASLDERRKTVAQRILSLTGVAKPRDAATDANGLLVAIDRMGQREDVWKKAELAKSRLAAVPITELRESIVNWALAEGHFSIWMTAFSDDPEMRQRFIEAFPGTARDCFDPVTTAIVSPRPPNVLGGAGKV